MSVFNPFDLQVGDRHHEPLQIQEVVNYCADRFRAILLYMRARYQDHDIPIWFNRTLEAEMVCAVYVPQF